MKIHKFSFRFFVSNSAFGPRGVRLRATQGVSDVTSALVVDARFVGRTFGVTSATRIAHTRPAAYLATPTVVVLATQGPAYGSGRVALFVAMTTGVGRAHRST